MKQGKQQAISGQQTLASKKDDPFKDDITNRIEIHSFKQAGKWWADICKNESAKSCTLGRKPPDTSTSKSKFAEKDLRLLVNTNFNMSQKHALGEKRANSVPHCIRQSMASRSKVDDSPLLSTDEATTGALCPALGSPVWGRYRHTGWSPVKGHKDGASLLWRKAETDRNYFFHPERARIGSYQCVQIPVGGLKEDGVRLFFMTSPSLVQGPSPDLTIITSSLKKKKKKR